MAATVQLRRKGREAGQPFVDTTQSATANSRYFQDLPAYLKPRAGVALTAQQLAVYETGFQRAAAH